METFKTVAIPEDCWEALKKLSLEKREPLQSVHAAVLRKALKLSEKEESHD